MKKHDLKSSLIILIALTIQVHAQNKAELPSMQELEKMGMEDWKNQIRREKFDMILPKIMKENGVDMWIHVMRSGLEDSFGSEDLGSSSGLIVFTDTGNGKIERSVLGRRWGATQRIMQEGVYVTPESTGVYDLIYPSVFVTEYLADPMTEYDFRFKGLREFIDARNPKVIAVNYRESLGPWETNQNVNDGISRTDYMLLLQELGDKYAQRLISSEYLMMYYQISPVPSEVELLKKMRADEMILVKQVFDGIKPGITKVSDLGKTEHLEVDITAFRRMNTGLSQRGRSAGWEDAVVKGGDLIAAPSQGKFAYVLKEGEKRPPADIKRIWQEYLDVENVLYETIRAGRTPREIVKDYTQKLVEKNIIVVGPQLHMFQPKNNFPTYSAGHDATKTLISIDLHGKGMGATANKHDIYLGPRIGSYGPEWVLDIPLSENHHFVLEYFFYMPSKASKGQDQYLLFWNHEQAIATKTGVELLFPAQKELILIK
ncbi:hypothetical protein [Maribacter antarcticus]|uniref:hypothetical protein n=1 Tax=Maribacter antarcticus TaxID=505250 RepID=UPI00047BFB1A|nr:hypothetical protein [Maribacter antarcticus]